jgi:hypothetical protein
MDALARTDLFRVDRERAFTFAICAVADLHLFRSILIKWTQDGAALSAIEFDILELREYTRPPGYDARHTDKVIQIACAEVAQGRAQRQISDTDVNFGVNTLVIGIVYENRSEGDLVENCEHCGRRVGEKVGEDGLG